MVLVIIMESMKKVFVGKTGWKGQLKVSDISLKLYKLKYLVREEAEEDHLRDGNQGQPERGFAADIVP